MDDNGLLYLRARYYNPSAGVFTALDPFEGILIRPMSLNGYSWVEGNTPNRVDPTGMWGELPSMWDKCGSGIPFKNGPQELFDIDVFDPDPCRRHKNNIADAIAELYRRATEQITNVCKLWEISQGIPVTQPSGCEGAGTWEGHQQQMRDVKRQLRRHLNRFNNTGRDGCPDEDGKVNETADAWLDYSTDELVPDYEAERQGRTQDLPPTLAYTPVCPGIWLGFFCLSLTPFA